jgi:hypothetical protein
MRPRENTEKIIKKFNIDVNPDKDREILDELQQAQARSKKSKPALPAIDLRRLIMKNRMTKFAAAAVLVVVALLSVSLFDKTSTPAYGLTEALQVYKQANILHVKGLIFFVKETENGQELQGLPYEKWIDQENGCFRTLSPAGAFGPSPDETPLPYLDVSDGRYLMETYWRSYVDDSGREPDMVAKYKEFSPFQQRLQIRNVKKNAMDLNYCDVAGFVRIGSEAVDDEVLDIWQGEVIFPSHAVPYNKMTVWLSPTSGQIKQLKRWDNTLLAKNDINWRLGSILNFEYDAIPPKDCFDLVPPPDCELENTKETAVKMELGMSFGNDRFYTIVGFTLNDGSVILGWHAHLKGQLEQEELFKDIEPGGPLPKLPAQISGLIPYPSEEDVTCFGHHLAYTQKGGKFYEWGLYVPNGIYNRGPFIRLKVKKEYFDNTKGDFNTAPNYVADEIAIDSEQEFNSWVLDAMAELSDDGIALEGITYDGVLELAQQIRESLN